MIWKASSKSIWNAIVLNPPAAIAIRAVLLKDLLKNIEAKAINIISAPVICQTQRSCIDLKIEEKTESLNNVVQNMSP
jgi:isocitrate/isopropylmalate dehydrogenase